ncbi:MAG: TonB-dependent receptor [Draconibacterium sp.]
MNFFYENRNWGNPVLKKILLVMKLTTVIILISIMHVSATVYSQTTKLSLNMQKSTIKEVLQKIESLSEFRFIYQNEQVDLNKKVNAQFKDEKVENILNYLFEQEEIEYSITSNNLILIKSRKDQSNRNIPDGKDIQQKIVTGKVTDSSGQPLPGVTVILKGTTNGTVTNSNGEYSLSNLPDNAILLYSFVGMKTAEVVVNNQTIINITMEEETIGIEEVVAVGYGTQERRRVTGSIATVKEEDFMQGAVYQSPLELISGRIGGLAISRSQGGDPTSDVEIQLRGASSINGTLSPLIIIDGVPGGYLNAISPENIASIDVLRDGSAAAIYGTRATNGVIIITTKKGIPGEPEIKYSAYAYSETWFNKPRILTSNEYRHYKEVFANSGDPFLEERAYAMIDFGGNTDWFDVISRNAISQVHNLSMSGGSESTQYYGSLNYRDQQGMIKNTAKNVINGTLSLSHRALEDRLTFQLSLNNSFIKSNPYEDDVRYQAITRNPTQLVYNDGTSTLNPDGIFWEEPGFNVPNPLGLIEQYKKNNEDARFLGQMQISYELLKGMKFSVNGSYQRSNQITGIYEEKDSWSSLNNTSYDGVASRSAYKEEIKTIEPMINYRTLFRDLHQVEALIGYSYQDFVEESFRASNRTFITDAFSYNNLGAGQAISEGKYANPVSSYKSSNKLIAFFGRMNYSYNNKYMLSLSLRHEGSTKFGKDNKWGNFPAISAGWNINRERFMESVSFINDLKLRFGYGVTGNQGISSYLSLQQLGTSGYMFYNGKWIQGYAPVSNANPNLRWEKKIENNLGFDIGLFNNIVVNVDLYNRKTTDLLYEYAVPVPPNLYGTTWANVGKISNKGIEMTFVASPISGKEFSWKTNFNISYNKNMLVSLSDENYDHSYLMLEMPNGMAYGFGGETAYKIEEGEPLGNIYGWEFAGFSEDGKWQVWNETRTEKIHPSTATFDDKKIIGNGMPKSYIGFINNFAYRRFDLAIALKGALGFEILNILDLGYENLGLLPANIPLTAITDPEISKLRDVRNYITSYHVEPGDYIKIDNVTLGYSIPTKVFKQFRVFASGKNLFCFTKYTGEDPEQKISGLMPGYDDMWSYPKVKTFSVGLNINF